MDRDTLTLAEFNAAKAAHRQTARAAGALDEGSARPQKAPVRADLPTLRYGGKTFAEWEQELLTELEPASRIQAIEAIRAFGLNGNAHEAIRAISHVVSASEDSTVFDAACQTLQAFGPPSVPILIEGFTQNKKHRGSAAGALGQIGPEAIEALPVLFEAGREGNDPAPPSLGYALANIALGDEASARMLAEAIEHAQSTVRGGIVNALAFTAATQPDRVVPLLLLALRDRKIDIRRVAALALATHAPSEQVVVDGLKRAIHDQTDESMRVLSQLAAHDGTNPDTVTPVFVEALRTVAIREACDDKLLSAIVKKLGWARHETDSVVSVLTRFLEPPYFEDSPEVVAAAIDALGDLGPAAKEAAGLIERRMLVEANDANRKRAARALRQIVPGDGN